MDVSPETQCGEKKNGKSRGVSAASSGEVIVTVLFYTRLFLQRVLDREETVGHFALTPLYCLCLPFGVSQI